jgi:UDP-N-acetylmuramoyl-tripeptide--D-alanyl-D-alanine ligase
MALISIVDLYQKFIQSSGVSTDTRNIPQNSIFFALKGPNFNANTLAESAIEKGALFAVVDEPDFVTNPKILLVEDGLKALQDLAHFHRKKLNIPVIGLTGSNGKTTTKELINCVLAKKYKTLATKGNLNNHIGVPLTILSIKADTEIAIIEMGANHQGEIKQLCEICEPTHALITNIGKAHLEGFGGIEGVKKGKGELYEWLLASKGTLFLNAQNETLMKMANNKDFAEKIVYQNPGGFIEVILKSDVPFVSYTDSQNNTIQTHLTGIYNFENIVNALAIGKYFKVSESDSNNAVANYQPDNNRSQFIEKGTNSILMDAYNANPSSMAAAISNFNNIKANKKMVILGDMLELGEDAPNEHEQLGVLLKKCNFDFILLAGPLMQNALIHLPAAYYFPDKFGLHTWLADHKIENTHILIKGSRGMGLESSLPLI